MDHRASRPDVVPDGETSFSSWVTPLAAISLQSLVPEVKIDGPAGEIRSVNFVLR
jgi:hypothetical protein